MKTKKIVRGSRYGALIWRVVAIKSVSEEIACSHRRILPQWALDLDVLVGLVEVSASELILDYIVA